MKLFYSSLISEPADMSTLWNSPTYFVGLTDTYTIQLTFIGIPEGTLSLECSIDKGRSEAGSTDSFGLVDTFVPINNSEQLITEAGTHTWSCTNTGYRWVRVRWVPSAGDGEIVEAQISGRNA